MTIADLALIATLRAAAPYQRQRQIISAHGMVILPRDYRQKVRRRPAAHTILFVVDASGSMGAYRRMVAVKGAILSLLLDAYQRRDRVGMVAFRGQQADVVLMPTSSIIQARERLAELPTGGATPLAHALLTAQQLLLTDSRRRTAVPLLVLVSDGRANVPLSSGAAVEEELWTVCARVRRQGIACLAIDTESGPLRLRLMPHWATALGARYVCLEELRAERVTASVRAVLGR